MRDETKLAFEAIHTGIELYAQRAIALSDDIAAHPELSFEEFRTSRCFADLLRNEGFAVESPFCDLPTAFCARKGEGGARIAFLVEYDALPEIGHACGHNLHGTLSVLASLALAFALEKQNVRGEVWAVGTPAEETDGAKVLMAERGVFDDCDLAVMFHSNAVDTYVDYRSLALDGFEFTFKGKAAHAAAAPWEGRNALNALEFFLRALHMLRQHVRPEIRMAGIVTNGGSAPNVIPEEARYRLEARAPRRGELDSLMEQIFNCARGAALATQTDVSFEKFMRSFDDMLPNPTGEALLAEILNELGVSVGSSPGPMGSTDVGNVSYRCPALQPELAITSRPFMLHTREFAKATVTEEAHRALLVGAEALARLGWRVLTDASLRQRIRKDFEIQKRKALGLSERPEEG